MEIQPNKLDEILGKRKVVKLTYKEAYTDGTT